MVRRIAVVLMIVAGSWLFVGQAKAQPANCQSMVQFFVRSAAMETVDGGSVTAGEPLIVPMVAGKTYRLSFQAREGQIATIRTTSVNAGQVNPFVEIVSPGVKALACSGDDDVQTLDAVLPRIAIPEDGIYTIVLATGNSRGEGEVALNVELR